MNINDLLSRTRPAYGGTTSTIRRNVNIPTRTTPVASQARDFSTPVTVSRTSIFGGNVVRQMQQSGTQTRMAPVPLSRSNIFGGTAPASISIAPRTLNGGGGIISGLAAGQGIMPPSLPTSPLQGGGSASTRTGLIPASTLTDRTPGATASVFGGESGGMGATVPAAGATDLGIGGIGDSISSFGSGIVDTINEYIPLAIKVILAVVVVKLILWLLRGRR